MQNGELVAQFKATVLLMPNGSDRVTSAPLQKLETEKKVGNLSFLQRTSGCNVIPGACQGWRDHRSIGKYMAFVFWSQDNIPQHLSRALAWSGRRNCLITVVA